jgi:hypothetical protein
MKPGGLASAVVGLGAVGAAVEEGVERKKGW